MDQKSTIENGNNNPQPSNTKLKFVFSQIKEFDVAAERSRIAKAFLKKKDKKIQQTLNKLVDLFVEEKYEECFLLMKSLGYDNENECPEIEYVSEFIYDAISFMYEYGGIVTLDKKDAKL